MNAEVWNSLFKHAQEDYPAECCGIITEEDGILKVHRCRNIQDRLHEKDPVAHPRTSKTAYRMDDMQVHRILTDTEAAGGTLRGFYHSHIDCEVYFSDEDKRAAMFLDEPAYPGVEYYIVSVMDGVPDNTAGFRWDEAGKAFVEMTL